MNLLVPIAFCCLTIIPNEDSTDATQIILSDGKVVDAIETIDTLTFKTSFNGTPLTQKVISQAVYSQDGGSRRFLSVSHDDNRFTDVIDGGPFAMQGLPDNLYITDRQGDTMTAWLTVYDANPVFSPAPEGGTLLELTDRIVMTVLNHDTEEKEDYILRDNQITYLIENYNENSDSYSKPGETISDPRSRFRLLSIRPKPNDMEYLCRMLKIYDVSDDATADEPMSYSQFSKWLNTLFPVRCTSSSKNITH